MNYMKRALYSKIINHSRLQIQLLFIISSSFLIGLVAFWLVFDRSLSLVTFLSKSCNLCYELRCPKGRLFRTEANRDDTRLNVSSSSWTLAFSRLSMRALLILVFILVRASDGGDDPPSLWETDTAVDFFTLFDCRM